jgi:hypothetical protein
MVAPGGKDQQGFGQRVHGVVQHQLAQLFGQRGAAGLAAERDGAPLGAKGLARPSMCEDLPAPSMPSNVMNKPGT